MRINFFKLIKYFLIFFGILIFIYFAAASLYRERIDFFYLTISFIGALITILSFKIESVLLLFKKLPKAIQYIIRFLFFCFILSFIIIQILIINNMRGVNITNNSGTDYLIILGCHATSENTTQLLAERGFAAVSYLNKNPETKVIVSGGQGYKDDITESEALKRLLLINNIDINRILTEDKSENTQENLKFSNDLYNLLDKNVIIVTSDYHIFRALSIAKKLKYTNVSALSSRSPRYILPALHIREYVSVIHNLIYGRL